MLLITTGGGTHGVTRTDWRQYLNRLERHIGEFVCAERTSGRWGKLRGASPSPQQAEERFTQPNDPLNISDSDSTNPWRSVLRIGLGDEAGAYDLLCGHDYPQRPPS